MKDLTHYFATPVKSCETAGSSVGTTTSSGNLTEKQKTIAIDKSVGEKSPSPKKRTKFKRKTIEVENNTLIPCHVIDDDSDSICESNPNDSNRTRESNAFEVLMTTTRRTTSGSSPPKSMQISKSDKVGQSKRKYGSFQDDDAAADKLKKKKAKLLTCEKKTEKTNDDDVVITEMLIGDNTETGMKKLPIDDRQAVVETSNTNSPEIANQLSISTRNESMPQTPKTRTKWSMKVKLQSYADTDVQSDDEYSSDEDFLFTPNSRAKFRRKSKSFQNDSELLSKNSDEPSQKDKREESCNNSNGRQKKKSIPRNIDSTDTNNDDSKTHSCKPRKKREKTKIHGEDVEAIDLTDSIQHLESKIDLAVIEAPTNQEKLKKSSKNKKNKSRNKEVAALHCEDMLPVAMSENESNLANTIEPVIVLSTKKLAPLFVKRPKLSSAVVEARRHFLQSGVPDSVKMKVTPATADGDNERLLPMPFPRISHVAEYDNSATERNVAVSFSYKQRDAYTPNLTNSCGCFTETVDSESLNSNMNDERMEKANVSSVLSEIESYCSEAQNMWQNINSMLNRTPNKVSKRRSKKLKLEKKSNTKVAEEESEHLNPTWTCKYKPTNLTEVIGNEASVSKLKDWLAGWKFSSNVNQNNSDDDFYSSSSSDSSRFDNNQVAVLAGPHGSGKTATVYAIAEELGYRVLEVNASARRTGKIMLTAFQEATKSHRVKKDQSLTRIRRSTERKAAHQKSLILIEDIDLVFEEDEGFVTAMFQLATNTKRPIILTCREVCPYLNKMSCPQLLVNFQAATGTRVSAFLELISLAESGYRLPQVCVDILLRNGDLRQSLLQLQYLLLTGPPKVSQLHYDGARSTLWLDMVPLLYKPLGKASKKAKKSKSMSCVAQPMNKLMRILNGISLASLLENRNSETWPVELSPSLSLDEDLNLYTRITDVGVDIADWLHSSLLGSKRTLDQQNFQAASLQARKRQARRRVDEAFSQAVPLILERRPLSVDYLPLLRTMCRTEEDRAKTSNRKGKRFHSHLNGLISVSEKILSTANNFLQDKQTTNVSDEL